MPAGPLHLLIQVPAEDVLQRLLDALTATEVAHEPHVYLSVIRDGHPTPVLAGDPR